MWERRVIYRALVGNPERKRQLGRPRHRWEYNIKVGLQEVGCGVMDWIELAEDRDRLRALVNAAMNLRVPSSLKPVSFSRISLLHGVSE